MSDEPRELNEAEVANGVTTRRETILHTPPDRPPSAFPAGRVPPLPMRYRPLRFHAKGGLGEVYIAQDMELGREVALKKIGSLYAQNADSRERFLFEAEITGQLEHPSIVPVYGLVSDADGAPCYAMRYIHGETLRDAIRRYHALSPDARRMELRALLGRFIAVCNAVAYAHNRGVLHRDIKPNNILLDKYGETLVVDWGLAKTVGSRQKAEGSEPGVFATGGYGISGSTRIGKAIGTPGYMSPEQAAGDWDKVGPVSDIYALGATLHDILAGPESETTPQSRPEEKDTMEYGLGVRRSGRAGIPRALAAICRKAMAQDPEQRYPTALVLAKDIENWLADEPVTAWREPWTIRARRWLGRHKALVTTVAGVVFVAAVSLAIATGLLAAANEREAAERNKAEENFRLAQQAHQRELGERSKAEENFRRAELAHQRELKERAKAEENFSLARQAVDRYYTEVSQNVLLSQPGMEDLRKRLLSTARDYYERLIQQRSDDPAVKAEYGKTYWRLAFITHAIESKPKAIEHYQKAAEIFDELQRQHPDNRSHQYNLGKSLNNLGFAQSELNKLDDADSSCRKALQVFEKLLEQDATPDFAKGAAAAYNNLALVYRSKKEEVKAEESHEKALAIRSRLVKDHPGVTEFQHDLAATLNNLGVLYRATRRPEKAEEAYKQGLELRQKLAVDLSHDRHQHDLANSHNNLGLLYRGLDRRDEAKLHLEKAQQIWGRVAKEHPRVVEYQNGLATNYANLGGLYARTKQLDEAEKHFQSAIRIWEELRKSHPTHAQFEIRLASSYGNMGTFLKESKDPKDALEWYAKAIALLQAAADQNEAAGRLRIAHWGRGEAYTLLKRHDEAIADFDRSVELSTGAARDMMRLQRAGALARMGRHAQAVAEAEPLVTAKEGIAPGVYYNGACVFALASVAAKNDATLPDAERDRLVESRAVRAVELLGQVKTAGFFARANNYEHLLVDPDLVSLHARSDFRALVASLKAK